MSEWGVGRCVVRRAVILAVAIALVGCESVEPEDDSVRSTATAVVAEPVVNSDATDRVSVQAVVEPQRVVTLISPAVGAVREVSVEEGQRVASGDLLMSIQHDDAETEAARADAGLTIAKAQLAVAQAGARSEEVAVLMAQADQADAALAMALAQLDTQRAGLSEVAAQEARVNVLDAQLAYERADSAHDDTMRCYMVPMPSGGETEICPTLGTLEEMARAQMTAAQAGLSAADAHLAYVQSSAQPELDAVAASVDIAAATRAAARARVDLALAGASAEEIAVAEAGVSQAAAALAQTREFVAQERVEAPFVATVTDIAVENGDVVATASPLVTLATLEDLRLRTTDLTEHDVADIAVGHPALVVFDAVPNTTLAARVSQIQPQGRSHYGDIVYDVIVEMDDLPAWVRWGMSAGVEIGTAPSLPLEPGVPSTDSEVSRSGRLTLVEASAAAARVSTLYFGASGELTELTVGLEDTVREGDVVARLDAAHEELAVARAAAALRLAEAEARLVSAGPSPEAVTAARADLDAARAGLAQASARCEAVADGVSEVEIATATAQLAATQAEKRHLEAALHWAEDGGDTERADVIRDQVNVVNLSAAAQESRLLALPAVGGARLSEASAGVAAARSQVSVAQAALDLLLAGPTPESLLLADAVVLAARVELTGAELALSRTKLIAPIDGTVTQLYAEVGDAISPDRPVLVLSDLTDLQLETVDLTELDVVRVCEGQAVTATIDALPGKTWTGQLTSIKLQSHLAGSDVVYPAVVRLDRPIPSLLPAMSAAVTFLSPDEACPDAP